MTALVIPGLEVGTWQVRSRSDPAARALADRHYSRKTKGAPWIGPPGRVLVLVTPCERAVWLTHWPRAELALDGLDAWRCSIFRNEGAGLSSELIEAAMALTVERWSDRPADGWLTWIDVTKVRSTNPGYCFKQAGWWLDRDWSHPRLVRLRARIDPAGQSTHDTLDAAAAPDDWAPCQGHPPCATAGLVGCSDHWPPHDHSAEPAEASAAADLGGRKPPVSTRRPQPKDQP